MRDRGHRGGTTGRHVSPLAAGACVGAVDTASRAARASLNCHDLDSTVTI
jgi:hypothetical protein